MTSRLKGIFSLDNSKQFHFPTSGPKNRITAISKTFISYKLEAESLSSRGSLKQRERQKFILLIEAGNRPRFPPDNLRQYGFFCNRKSWALESEI